MTALAHQTPAALSSGDPQDEQVISHGRDSAAFDGSTLARPAGGHIVAADLSKCYYIYDRPQDRLKQSLVPRLQRAMAPAARLVGFDLPPRRYYRDFWALHGVSFTVGPGETVGIIGRNGSGKSTLLQLVCGTLTPTQGTVSVQGRVAALLELGSGFNPDFTGRENIHLNASILGLTPEQINERLDDIIAFADIGDFIDQPLKTYSSGMAVRLAFAVIVHVDADILIIDEALAVGDAFFQQKCMRWLRRFRETGTILFVSHDTNSVTNLCDRALWLERGELRMEGNAKEVCETYFAHQYSELVGIDTAMVKAAGGVAADPGTAPPPRRRGPADSPRDLPPAVTVFEFNEQSSSFGNGEATIIAAHFAGPSGEPQTWLEGGEALQLVLRIRCNAEIRNPIAGFIVKDSLGQNLFGENTAAHGEGRGIVAAAGDELEARFHFHLPHLRSGDYSVTAAIASGTIHNHVQHHWLHDALMFRVHSPFRDHGVMMVLPMESVGFTIAKSGGAPD